MQMTAGKEPSAFLGRAMFSCSCWPSGLAYSMPVSKLTSPGTTGSFCAHAHEPSSRERLTAIEHAGFADMWEDSDKAGREEGSRLALILNVDGTGKNVL